MSIRLVAFDLDGTLVDSLRDLADSANELLIECGAQPLDRDAVGRMVGDGAATLVARAFAAAHLPLPATALERFLTIYDARLLKFTRPYPGVVDTLAVLSKRVTLALLTNKPLAATNAILRGLSLAEFFPSSNIVGGDGSWPRKPDPAGLRHLMTATGCLPEQTMLVGDSIVDWKTGGLAGCAVCLVRYGFGFQGVSESDLSIGTRVIANPADLLAML